MQACALQVERRLGKHLNTELRMIPNTDCNVWVTQFIDKQNRLEIKNHRVGLGEETLTYSLLTERLSDLKDDLLRKLLMTAKGRVLYW